MKHKKMAALHQESSHLTALNYSNDSSNTMPAGKLNSMLFRFAEGNTYHRFIAESLGDHCLPTTISDLQKKYRLYFNRRMIKVPNRFGGMTSVKMYWLEGDNLKRAKKLCGLGGGQP